MQLKHITGTITFSNHSNHIFIFTLQKKCWNDHFKINLKSKGKIETKSWVNLLQRSYAFCIII